MTKWREFVDSFSSPGGRTFLLASMWISLLLLLFIAKMRGVAIEATGQAFITDASKILLGGMLFSMGQGGTSQGGTSQGVLREGGGDKK